MLTESRQESPLKRPEMLPVRIYTPEPALQHPRVLIGSLIADVWKGRELAWRLFIRDISAQYRQTFLGYLWAFLPPLVASMTFIFLQRQGVVNIQEIGIPYAAFAMMGTLLWQTFVESMQSPVSAIQNAKPMLAKINFPREAILVAGMYMVLFNTLIRLVLLSGVMLYWGITPGPSLLFFPIAMLGLMACGFSIGMLLVPVGTLYNDVAKGIPILAQFWMLLTPVVYPAGGKGMAAMIARLNPIAPLITAARSSLSGDAVESPFVVVAILAAAIVMATLGLIAFRLVIPRLIERMGG